MVVLRAIATPRLPPWLPFLLLNVLLVILPREVVVEAIPRPVAGTAWRLHSLRIGDAMELQPVLPNTTITAHFGDGAGGDQASGPLTGAGGCLAYETTYRVDYATLGLTIGPTMSIASIAGVGVDCDRQPVGAVIQDQAYLDALKQVKRHAIYGDKLELRDDEWKLLLELVPLEDDDDDYSSGGEGDLGIYGEGFAVMEPPNGNGGAGDDLPTGSTASDAPMGEDADDAHGEGMGDPATGGESSSFARIQKTTAPLGWACLIFAWVAALP